MASSSHSTVQNGVKLNKMPEVTIESDRSPNNFNVDPVDGSSSNATDAGIEEKKTKVSHAQQIQVSNLVKSLNSNDENESEDNFNAATNNFLWEAHSITAFSTGTAVLFYFVFFATSKDSVETNVQRGIIAMMYAFLMIGITLTQNGPVIRPHPVFWRLLLCGCFLYELGLIFFLFQTVSDARRFLLYVDPNLNKPIDYKDYSGGCEIWDPGHPDGPFHNVMDKMDIFVIGHLVGWFWKALIFRDVWITNVISFTFELLEYTFQHQLPNFAECWWDHWILDFVVCNGLGIFLGLKCLKYLSIKEYKWTNLWHIHSYKGKMKRVVGQFTPYEWVKFNWKPTQNLYRWLAVSLMISIALLAELNTFYLKFLLWIPPDHPFVSFRLCLFALWGFVGVREAHDYATDKSKNFGQQACLLLSVIMTESMIVLKFGWNVLTIPLPTHVKYFWLTVLILYIAFCVWKFQVKFPVMRQWIKNKLKEIKLLMFGYEAPQAQNEDSESSSEGEQY